MLGDPGIAMGTRTLVEGITLRCLLIASTNGGKSAKLSAAQIIIIITEIRLTRIKY